MCGIGGVLGSSVGAGEAGPLIAALPHRGPDGIRLADGPGWSLGHARLSIIDLEGGWQPLTAAGSTVIGNGEIYNYVELTAEFGLKGRLATGSDFEPMLHLYAREGPQAFRRLRGMYAFCHLGPQGERALVRDGFGIKPLYYSWRGQTLGFASEPRALLGVGRPRLNPERVEELLAFHYTLGEGTVFEGVRRLAPGGMLSWDEPEAPPSLERLEDDWVRPARNVEDEGEALARLDRVLEDSVRVHQRSDVPYGLFLSGGVDSGVVAALMARLNTRPVIAYTCGFEAEGARDERAQAERLARALDLDWREIMFGEAEFWETLPEIAWALDDPTTDYAALPTWKLAQAARERLTVVLTGEGADELFGGYGRYRRALRPGWLGGRSADARVEGAVLKTGGRGLADRWRAAATEGGRPAGLSRLQTAQLADIRTWLHADVLLKLDRTLMAHGLEGRTPFLDREVAAFAFNLPDRFKVRGRYGKWLLRKWLEKHLPAADPWAKKKGFTVPVAAWIAPRAADIAPRIATHEGLAQVCDMEAVRAVFERNDHPSARWPLLFYAVWWNIHVAGMERRAALEALLGTV